MASTGTAFFPGSSSFPNTTQYPGQGLYPIARCRISYDDVSVANPSWNDVTNSDLRGFSVERGRDTELSEFDAGTATIVIDNRDRAFDPLNNSSIRPLNRVWLYEEFSGEVHDLFRGYVTSWEQDWPNGGWSDATATATCSDEFLVLSQAALPTTVPPRESYAELIASDNPIGYWDMNEDPAGRTRVATEAAPPPPLKPIGLIEFRRHDLRRATRAARKKH